MTSYLEQLLNVYWLRPESAIIRAIDANILENQVIESPSLDFGCGDGIFSFIGLGKGQFKNSFDAYLDLDSNIDSEKYFNNLDVYDYNTSKSIDKIKKPANFKMDYALDHKQNLLDKAKTLNFYDNLICCDGNNPEWANKFEDNYFSTIFSNIIYWLDDPTIALKEFKRILKPGGKIILMVPDTKYLEASFYQSLYVNGKNPDWKWLELIDRGRSTQNVKICKNYSDWLQIFSNSDLKVFNHTSYLSPAYMRIDDIGLRPLFPVIHNAICKLDNVDRQEIKEQWIKLILNFAVPLFEMESKFIGQNGCYHNFILTK